MTLHTVEEHLERRAVEQVLTRVDFIAEINARIFVGVEDWMPALGELFEGGLEQPWRALRPREEVGPGK